VFNDDILLSGGLQAAGPDPPGIRMRLRGSGMPAG
jgi:hypothetical protein